MDDSWLVQYAWKRLVVFGYFHIIVFKDFDKTIFKGVHDSVGQIDTTLGASRLVIGEVKVLVEFLAHVDSSPDGCFPNHVVFTQVGVWHGFFLACKSTAVKIVEVVVVFGIQNALGVGGEDTTHGNEEYS